jgi:hypothetical protein
VIQASNRCAFMSPRPLPKLKFGNAQLGLAGEAGIPITMPFQALKYEGAGIEQTTVAFSDTAAVRACTHTAGGCKCFCCCDIEPISTPSALR